MKKYFKVILCIIVFSVMIGGEIQSRAIDSNTLDININEIEDENVEIAENQKSDIDNITQELIENIWIYIVGTLSVIFVLCIIGIILSFSWERNYYNNQYKIVKRNIKRISKKIIYNGEMPFEGDIYKIYYTAYQYNILKNKYNILGAILLKWLKEGKIDLKRQKEDIFVIFFEESLNTNFENEFEKSLYKMLWYSTRDRKIEKEQLKSWCKRNFKKITELINGDILRDYGKKFISEDLIKKSDDKFKFEATEKLEAEAFKTIGFKDFLNENEDLLNTSKVDKEIWIEHLIYVQMFKENNKIYKINNKDYLIENKDFENIYDLININLTIDEILKREELKVIIINSILYAFKPQNRLYYGPRGERLM